MHALTYVVTPILPYFPIKNQSPAMTGARIKNHLRQKEGKILTMKSRLWLKQCFKLPQAFFVGVCTV